MSIIFNALQATKVNSLNFMAKPEAKKEIDEQQSVAKEFVSKEASEAIASVALAKVNRPELDLCQLYEVPMMPTAKDLLKDVKEPILVDDEVVWDPNNFEKINVQKLVEKFGEAPAVKAFSVEGAVNHEYANVRFTKWANDSYSLHFEKETESGASSDYSMSFNEDGNIKYFSKTTEIDVDDDKPIYKVENINYRRKTADVIYNDSEVELGASYHFDDADKLLEVNKYINEMCDDFPYLGKEAYDGCIDDDAAVEKLLELRNR